jgi:hypothetical protein
MRRVDKLSDIVFVHVPKTGGTFLNFQNLFPNQASRVHEPLSSLLNWKENLNKSLFTMVRDPYDIACSEYYFMKKNISFKTRNPSYLKHAKLIYKDKLSIEEYLEKKIKNSIYPFYYDVKTPKDFDCVGVTEEMDKTVSLIYSMFDISSGNGEKNNNIDKKINQRYETEYPRDFFQKENSKDYELYFEGKEKFIELCKNFLN